MRVLGISAFYHDSAAALVRDGRVVAAAQEERFTRRKHDSHFPANAVAFCLAREGVTLDELDAIAFYDKPFLKFERLLETYLAFAPRGFRSFHMAMPLWVREKLFQRGLLERELRPFARRDGWQKRLLFAEHHFSHAASAFFPSPFERAAILTMDGVGEWATTSAATGAGNKIEIRREIHFPHSLGLLYSAFTYYLGFRVNSGEYKVMGLAPYGKPRYTRAIRDRLLDLKDDGSFRLNLDYFDYCTGLRMTNRRFHALFGGAPRRPDEAIEERHMDIAASIQSVTEEAVLRMTDALADESGEENLCLAGGVALNCVANGRVLREGRWKRIWIQPAAGDAGGALGAALAAYHTEHGYARSPESGDAMQGSLLGPEFTTDEIAQRLRALHARFTVLDDATLLRACAQALAAQKALGWFQGRMEFGPRALGNRSILADPRSASMQSVLNLKVKFRESFRPFAPAVLCEHAGRWFDLGVESPYMLMTAPVAQEQRIAPGERQQEMVGLDLLKTRRSTIPAVTHVDCSARVQTVDRARNPRFHDLLSEFHALTDCPVLVNTSFNVRGEPIVCTPEDAFRCLMGTEIEALAVGNCLLIKDEQDPAARLSYEHTFAPD